MARNDDRVAVPKELAEKPVLLIGEGADEEGFFECVVEHLGLSSLIQVEQYGGKNNLFHYLNGLQIRDNFERVRIVGITRDADEDPASANASIDSAIAGSKISAVRSVTIDRFVVPGTGRKGALEDLVRESLAGNPAEVCIEQFFKCLAGVGLGTTRRGKAWIQAWQATLPKDVHGIHRSAQKDFIDISHPAFVPLTIFVQALCEKL